MCSKARAAHQAAGTTRRIEYASLLVNEALLHQKQGKPDEYMANNMEALAVYEACGICGNASTPPCAILLSNTGIGFKNAEDGPNALKYFEQAKVAFELAGATDRPSYERLTERLIDARRMCEAQRRS